MPSLQQLQVGGMGLLQDWELGGGGRNPCEKHSKALKSWSWAAHAGPCEEASEPDNPWKLLDTSCYKWWEPGSVLHQQDSGPVMFPDNEHPLLQALEAMEPDRIPSKKASCSSL